MILLTRDSIHIEVIRGNVEHHLGIDVLPKYISIKISLYYAGFILNRNACLQLYAAIVWNAVGSVTKSVAV